MPHKIFATGSYLGLHADVSGRLTKWLPVIEIQLGAPKVSRSFYTRPWSRDVLSKALTVWAMVLASLA
jgi:hypothetical protein